MHATRNPHNRPHGALTEADLELLVDIGNGIPMKSCRSDGGGRTAAEEQAKRIRGILGARTTAHATFIALRQGLIPLDRIGNRGV